MALALAGVFARQAAVAARSRMPGFRSRSRACCWPAASGWWASLSRCKADRATRGSPTSSAARCSASARPRVPLRDEMGAHAQLLPGDTDARLSESCRCGPDLDARRGSARALHDGGDPEGAVDYARVYDAEIERVRGRAAELIGAGSDEIAFVKNTARALESSPRDSTGNAATAWWSAISSTRRTCMHGGACGHAASRP